MTWLVRFSASALASFCSLSKRTISFRRQRISCRRSGKSSRIKTSLLKGGPPSLTRCDVVKGLHRVQDTGPTKRITRRPLKRILLANDSVCSEQKRSNDNIRCRKDTNDCQAEQHLARARRNRNDTHSRRQNTREDGHPL